MQSWNRMRRAAKPANLQGLLEELETTAGGPKEISFKELQDAIGRRSFAPLLLLASLLGFTPLGVVPGGPTILAIVMILVAGQVALGRHSLWMPSALLRLNIDKSDLQEATSALKPFARWVDMVIRPRLSFLTEPPYSFVMAATCVLLALPVPPLEFVPLVDMPLWGAMVAFSLALFAHDGVLAIIAFALTATGIYFSISALL
jgi:hypothetical protein